VVVDNEEGGGLHARVRQQLAGTAGVLAGDGVGFGEGPDGPGREVPEVADRRSHDDETP
jgi:hypothetical protein